MIVIRQVLSGLSQDLVRGVNPQTMSSILTVHPNQGYGVVTTMVAKVNKALGSC